MNDKKWPARAIFPIAPPGFKFILMTILVSGMLFYLKWFVAAWIAAGITVFICWFFRDPHRRLPEDENSLISPADGKVIIVDRSAECEYLEGTCLKISIFMNVLNVHVNRMPFDGIVEKVVYHPGKFMNASFDKASVHNERNALIIRTPGDIRFAVVQIAGLIARRIVNCAQQGDRLEKGTRYGMIQFGSRLDLYLPPEFEVAVELGDKTKAGSSIIGYFK
jgi:phosphatidylserine decarboxylase